MKTIAILIIDLITVVYFSFLAIYTIVKITSNYTAHRSNVLMPSLSSKKNMHHQFYNYLHSSFGTKYGKRQ